ncbi:MAG: UDP-glucuronate 4-epimerase, partial [Candidatus Woesearchaeota archaeon]
TLLDQGHAVIGVDIVNDYYDVRMKQARQKQLLSDKFTFYQLDIASIKDMAPIFEKHKIDTIIHLAAQAGVRYSVTNPWAYEHSNNLGTLTMFECARKHNIRILYASSGSVYGATTPPFKESQECITPVSLYGATKRANELLAHSYYKMYGVKSVGLRFFTVYGTYGRPDLAMFIFTKKILKGEPISVYNGGDMVRTFTHITDIVAGIQKIIEHDELECELFNLSGGEAVTLNRYIELIEERVGQKAQKNMMPMQPGDVREAVADITKAKQILNYEPQMTLDKGISEFTNWFMKNKEWLLELEDGKQ